MKKRVLIAHQSGIPHYRVPFYNELARLAPRAFDFDVVCDPRDSDAPRRGLGETQRELPFSTLMVDTLKLRLFGKTIRYQTFLRRLRDYDLAVVEHAVNNLSYPLSQVFRARGMPLVYWGHGRDVSAERPSLVKRLSERLKIEMAKSAEGYFAYTEGVKAYLVDKGVAAERIFVLENTIDIIGQRDAYLEHRPRRDAIRKEMDLEGKRVLLFVGRLTPGKRLNFLLQSFEHLHRMAPAYRLMIVGDGERATIDGAQDSVRNLGPVVDRDKLAQIYVASDVFAFPGAVGLGPLQALCYDLPVVAIEGNAQKPEFEYLSEENSIILPNATNLDDYALAIHGLFEGSPKLASYAGTIWPSIAHLTIENMAHKFISGVQAVLAI